MMEQGKFENALMEALTDGDHPALRLLRQQYEAAASRDREFTGVGFHLNLDVPANKAPAFSSDFHFGDVLIETDDLDGGAGVVVRTSKGYLSEVECYSYGDSWSDGYPNVRFSYVSTPRDLSALPST